MSTEQPGDDPFRKKPQPGEPRPGEPPSAPPPPDESGQGQAGGPPYGAPYGSPYADPYGGGTGAVSDPLAGMPPLGSRGKRLLARIIDGFVIGIPVYLLAALFTGFDYGYDSADGTGSQYWFGGVYTLVYFLYEGLMLSRSGQTVGKRLMHLRVAILRNGQVPGGAPAWVRAGIYHIPTLVPCLGFLFWLVNVLFCTWDKPYQQCVHDKGAKTVVVRAD
jgi:uncharacterized RDD family membrane protein YckC